MRIQRLAILGTVFLCLAIPAAINLAQKPVVKTAVTPTQRATAPAAAATAVRTATPGSTAESQSALIKQYCSSCHNDVEKKGGMTLTAFDVAHPERSPELTEKIIHKLRTGMMPKVGAPRPAAEVLKTFAASLETTMDRASVLHPNPGSRPFQRLTRDEYAHSVRDLLGVEEDVAEFLPQDSLSNQGFDNSGESQQFSATLMEGYMRAAFKISRDALGDPKAEATSDVYKLSRTASQVRHVEGTPFGTRGGISVLYNFPADGEYNFRSLLHCTPTGQLFGWLPDEQLEVSIDGVRVALLNIDPRMSESLPTGMNLTTGHIPLKAGPHRVAAAFIVKHSELVDDSIAQTEHTLADTDIGDYRELTEYTHLREFEISGPYNVTGVSDTPSRRKIFSCRPTSAKDELPCATKVITDLAREAYRKPVSPEDLEGLMSFYEQGRKGGDFESGVRMAVQAVLASPQFVFRLENAPASVKPGATYRISDLELASRLSYFLWSSMPDDELINLANQNKLRDPIVFEKQVRRMLNDSRAESLSTKFATQWLNLAGLDVLHPDAFYYPYYDSILADGMKKETQLFFGSIVSEDRNILDLLTANYTFVNERVAKHYGIPNVGGEQFRRVELTDDYRRGLLGKGAILALTSLAERTSPVQRGKWVMGVLLGTPPPAPPPVVPKFDETPGAANGKSLTVRERMEMHRANPTCNSCHQMIDPVGLALENFDVTGQWRTLDKTASISSAGIRIHTAGVPIDTKSTLYDGTPLDGPASLRQAILNHSDAFIDNFTEKLMSYAIGRKVEWFDMPLIRSIDRDAAKNNNRFSTLVLGIAKSPAFQTTRAEGPATDTAAKDNKTKN